MSHKWTGPACCVTGLVMLAVQVYAYLDSGLISSWLLGGGIGLFFVGAASWFYDIDDNRSVARPTSNNEFPTEKEFDRRFDGVTPDDSAAPLPRGDDDS